MYTTRASEIRDRSRSRSQQLLLTDVFEIIRRVGVILENAAPVTTWRHKHSDVCTTSLYQVSEP